MTTMLRREFLLSASFLCSLRAQGEPASLVYKKADGCDIQADVFGIAEKVSKPAAVWIHGGALISGSRKLSPKTAVLRSLLDAGFTVISIDYRLAPETKLPAIIEDVQDAFRWVRSQAGILRIDPERIGVCGGSARGYLTLRTGFCVEPGPKAPRSVWGYGGIVGAGDLPPRPFYLQQPGVARQTGVGAVCAE